MDKDNAINEPLDCIFQQWWIFGWRRGMGAETLDLQGLVLPTCYIYRAAVGQKTVDGSFS